MPNWCENRLTISGAKQGLEIFREYARRDEELLCFDVFVPYPEEFKNKDRIAEAFDAMRDAITDAIVAGAVSDEGILMILSKAVGLSQGLHVRCGFNSGGHEWCCSHWGTKWSCCNEESRMSGDNLVFVFDTAWSPPVPVVVAMGKMFPVLRFELEYAEPGEAFRGTLIMEDGEVTDLVKKRTIHSMSLTSLSHIMKQHYKWRFVNHGLRHIS